MGVCVCLTMESKRKVGEFFEREEYKHRVELMRRGGERENATKGEMFSVKVCVCVRIGKS